MIYIVPENDLHRNSLGLSIKSNCYFHDNYTTRVHYLQVNDDNHQVFRFWERFICLKTTSTKRGRVRSKTNSTTPSIINILTRTKDDQVSIIVRTKYLYNLYSMWSQIKHARFFLFLQTASVISPREKRTGYWDRHSIFG